MTGTPVPANESNRFFTISNLLSISRAVLAIPFVAVMLSGRPDAKWWGIAIMAVGALTDRYDGILARRLNQITEWGKILDPLADKIGVAAVALVLWVRQDIPGWFILIILLRDVLIFSGGMWLKRRVGIVLPSNTAGKWTVGVVSLALGSALVGLPDIATMICIAASVVMLLVSFSLYVQRFVEVLKEQAGPDGIAR
jgi:CDP-diacylglycerol--glycerol-3-phosphate 3-phosphatidyltransferase